MRTTLELPDDLHRIATQVARSSGQSLSRTVAILLRSALHEDDDERLSTDPKTGLRVFTAGRRIDESDVRSLDDDA